MTSFLKILYPDHTFLRSVTQANLYVDNRLLSTRLEDVLKTSFQDVFKTF